MDENASDQHVMIEDLDGTRQVIEVQGNVRCVIHTTVTGVEALAMLDVQTFGGIAALPGISGECEVRVVHFLSIVPSMFTPFAPTLRAVILVQETPIRHKCILGSQWF